MVTHALRSDIELVRLVREGAPDQGAAERELCLRFLPRIRIVLARRLPGIFEIDDLAHDVVLALLQAVREGRVEEPGLLGAYALGVCRNKAREVLRERRRRARALSRLEPPPLPGVDVPRLQPGRLEECLHKLQPRERTLLRMTFVEGRSAGTAGAELSVSPENARVIRHRALDKLRRCLRVGRYDVERR